MAPLRTCTHRPRTHTVCYEALALHRVDREWNDYILARTICYCLNYVIGESCCVAWVYLVFIASEHYFIWHFIHFDRIERL